jgi:hypothetical protein
MEKREQELLDRFHRGGAKPEAAGDSAGAPGPSTSGEQP